MFWRRLLVLLTVVATFLLAPFAYAAYYKVNVSRIDQDLYKDHPSGVLIETRFCFEFVYFQDAVLKYEEFAHDNELIFDSGTVCDVKGLR